MHPSRWLAVLDTPIVSDQQASALFEAWMSPVKPQHKGLVFQGELFCMFVRFVLFLKYDFIGLRVFKACLLRPSLPSFSYVLGTDLSLS